MGRRSIRRGNCLDYRRRDWKEGNNNPIYDLERKGEKKERCLGRNKGRTGEKWEAKEEKLL